MERREFLKLTLGFTAAAGAVAATAASAQAAPLMPSTGHLAAQPPAIGPEPALTNQDEVDAVRPEQVQWGRRRRRYRRYRRYYWRPRYWRRRYWRRRRRVYYY